MELELHLLLLWTQLGIIYLLHLTNGCPANCTCWCDSQNGWRGPLPLLPTSHGWDCRCGREWMKCQHLFHMKTSPITWMGLTTWPLQKFAKLINGDIDAEGGMMSWFLFLCFHLFIHSFHTLLLQHTPMHTICTVYVISRSSVLSWSIHWQVSLLTPSKSF